MQRNNPASDPEVQERAKERARGHLSLLNGHDKKDQEPAVVDRYVEMHFIGDTFIGGKSIIMLRQADNSHGRNW